MSTPSIPVVAIAIAASVGLCVWSAFGLFAGPPTENEVDQRYFDAARETDFAYIEATLHLLDRRFPEMTQAEREAFMANNYDRLFGLGQAAWLGTHAEYQRPSTFQHTPVASDFDNVRITLNMVIFGARHHKDPTDLDYNEIATFNWACWRSGWSPRTILGTQNREPVITCDPRWDRDALVHEFSGKEKAQMIGYAVFEYAKAERDARAA